MDNNSFKKALANAQKLMLSEDFNAKVEASARAFRGGSNNGGGISSSEMALFEQQAFGSRQTNEKPIQMIEEPTSMDNLDKLPESIRESFAKLPPQTGQENDNTILGAAARELKKNVMTEQVSRPHVSSVGGTVDYSLIKMIVNECLKEALSGANLGMLNESAVPMLKGMRIGEGNKIQLLDTKGNLYEGVLKLKKKA